MAVDLIVAYEAEQDIAQAYAWYESQRVGLGEDFLGRLDACIRTVLRNPEMYAFVHETYRRALVRRFPYAMAYEYENEAVTIYCVFHTSRDPNKWRERLP
jgi:plasmid stabilization system protein ParE